MTGMSAEYGNSGLLVVLSASIRPPMTTVCPSGIITFGGHVSAGCLGNAGRIQRAGAILGVDLHPHDAVGGNERPQPQLRANVHEVDGLGGAGLTNRRSHVAKAIADLEFGPLLVDHQQAGGGEDLDIGGGPPMPE